MPYKKRPVSGCGMWSHSWLDPRGHPLPGPDDPAFTLELDTLLLQQKPAYNRICNACYCRHQEPERNDEAWLNGRTRVVPAAAVADGVLSLLAAARHTSSSSEGTAPSASSSSSSSVPSSTASSSSSDPTVPPPITASPHLPPNAPPQPLAWLYRPLAVFSPCFISTLEVIARVYSTDSPHPGLAMWYFRPEDCPEPPQLKAILNTGAEVDQMQLATFAHPNTSSVKLPKKRPSKYLQRRRAHDPVVDALDELKEQMTRPDSPLTIPVPYMRDIVAKKARELPTSSEPQLQRTAKRARRATRSSSSASPDIASAGECQSPFNTLSFSLASTNLLSLMQDYGFPGFSSASWFFKIARSFFCLHVEQLFAPFYNICYRGSTTWYVVRREDMDRLKDYMVTRAKQWYGVDETVGLTAAESEAVMGGLLFTKASVFHPHDLQKAGIRLTEVTQRSGMVVAADGDLVHFGMCTTAKDAHSVNEAMNFLPIRWLTTGLPRLADWVHWLQDKWLPLQKESSMKEPSKQRLREAMLDKQTNVLVAKHCAPLFCHLLLTRLQALLKDREQVDFLLKHPESQDSWFATREAILLELEDKEMEETFRLIEDVLTVMESAEVGPWLLQHGFDWNSEEDVVKEWLRDEKIYRPE